MPKPLAGRPSTGSLLAAWPLAGDTASPLASWSASPEPFMIVMWATGVAVTAGASSSGPDTLNACGVSEATRATPSVAPLPVPLPVLLPAPLPVPLLPPAPLPPPTSAPLRLKETALPTERS
eukprot:225648-Prymnesium_polylepis.1